MPVGGEPAMGTTSDARFWDRAARKYAAAKVSDTAAYARTLDSTTAVMPEGCRVVELGCGTGSTALALAPRAASYLATDLSPEMIAIARSKLDADPVAGLEFRVATAEDLARDGVRADVVLAFNYLHLVRDLPATLRSIRALLGGGGGGVFVSKTPCLGDMTPLIGRVLVPALRAVGMAPYAGSFSADGLCGALREGGFKVVAVERHASKGRDHRPFVVARCGPAA